MSNVETNVRDPARLWKLRDLQILDTQAESVFDDIAKVAAALCGTPIALVSLVDADRQWFKARVGLELTETPVEQAVCAYALGQDELLQIEDLEADSRTSSNPLVTAEDGIRFYAGTPLNTQDGYTLGTLCVIDTEVRPGGLNEIQREGLAALGRQVMKMLEMRQTLIQRDLQLVRHRRRDEIMRRQREERNEQARQKSVNRRIQSHEAQEAARIGTFEVDIAAGQVKISPEFCRIFGIEEVEVVPAELLENIVHPDDRDIRSNGENRGKATAQRDVEYRIVRPIDGKMRWVARRASFDFDANGKPIRMLGTAHDVTERRFALERMRYLLELGDRLHIAETIGEAAEAAGESLRKSMNITRAGYATIDLLAGRLTVEHDSVAEGVQSVRGWRELSEYPETLPKLREGLPLAIADVRNAPWLEKEAEEYVSVGAVAQLWIPIHVHETLVGVLFAQHDEPRFWTKDEREFAESVAYRTYMTIAKLQAQVDQDLLNKELGHRLKNMLAMIMALATQSLKSVTEKDAVDTFRKRLMAFGSAHEDLLRHSWSGGSITSILTGVLEKIMPMERVKLSGAEIILGPRAALSLSLIAHELGTNALKYGALSVEGGSIGIDWDIDKSGDDDVFTLSWAEQGGPPVNAPTRAGFGSQLIQLGLMGTGDARTEFKQDGLIATFTAPLQLAMRA